MLASKKPLPEYQRFPGPAPPFFRKGAGKWLMSTTINELLADIQDDLSQVEAQIMANFSTEISCGH